MFLRKIDKLDWKTALGELLIVAAGVLVALAIDQWNAERLERREEQRVLAQLLQDVRADITQLEWMRESVAEKKASLHRVRDALQRDPASIDAVAFLTDVVDGANWGWNQSKVERSTFDQLLGSGEFSLIEDETVRRSIANYYSDWSEYLGRSDARETAYPGLSFQLVPRGSANTTESTVDGQIATLGFDPATAPEQVERLLRDVYASELQRHVVAELNFAMFLEGMVNDLLRDARALEQLISDHLDGKR